jgi:exodeoxyribonuclease VII small subunit
VSEVTGIPQATMFETDGEPELRASRGGGSPAPEPELHAAVGDAAPRSPSSPEPITFEHGYEELKAIVARLDDPDLPIHEMFEGFRRGKGLERALRAYLQEREGELAELEAGTDLVEFEIVAPSG